MKYLVVETTSNPCRKSSAVFGTHWNFSEKPEKPIRNVRKSQKSYSVLFI